MFLEFKIARGLHMEELSRRFVFVNLGFSIAISLLFGFLFPAAGMTIATGGILSTVLSEPMYSWAETWRTRTKPALDNAQSWYEPRKESIRQTLLDLARLIGMVIFVLTLPFRLLRWVLKSFDKTKEVVGNVRHVTVTR